MTETSVYRFNSADSMDPKEELLSGLISKAKAGDQGSFAGIYNLYFEKIFRFIYYRISHKEAAEDLTEDVFIKAFGKLSTIEKDASFEGWLYRIARNRVIDYYRDKKQVVPLEEVENVLEYDANVIDMMELKERQKIMLSLLKELGPDQRTVIRLKFLEDLDNASIADIMGKNEGAIRVIQHRALARMKDLLKKNGHHS